MTNRTSRLFANVAHMLQTWIISVSLSDNKLIFKAKLLNTHL